MQSPWYYSVNGQTLGPVSTEQLFEIFHKPGGPGRETLVYNQELTGGQWIQAKVVQDLVPIVGIPPPPPPTPPASSLRKNSASSPPSLLVPVREWYYQDNGTQVGPVADSIIRQMLESGLLAANTLVRNPEQTNWLPALAIPCFVASLPPSPPCNRLTESPHLQEIKSVTNQNNTDTTKTLNRELQSDHDNKLLAEARHKLLNVLTHKCENLTAYKESNDKAVFTIKEYKGKESDIDYKTEIENNTVTISDKEDSGWFVAIFMFVTAWTLFFLGLFLAVIMNNKAMMKGLVVAGPAVAAASIPLGNRIRTEWNSSPLKPLYDKHQELIRTLTWTLASSVGTWFVVVIFVAVFYDKPGGSFPFLTTVIVSVVIGFFLQQIIKDKIT